MDTKRPPSPPPAVILKHAHMWEVLLRTSLLGEHTTVSLLLINTLGVSSVWRYDYDAVNIMHILPGAGLSIWLQDCWIRECADRELS